MKTTWIKFIFFTFLLTYASHGTLAVLNHLEILQLNTIIGQILYILGGSSPTIMAFVIVHLFYSEDERSTFYTNLARFKQPFSYYLFALFTPIGLGLIFLMMAYLIGNPVFDQVTTPLQFLVLFLPAILFGGLEEVGWRGILQDQLQSRYRLLPLAVFIGLVWGAWHLPMYLIPGLGNSPAGILPFVLQGIVFSLFMTWLYARTTSIPLVVVFHASINAAAGIGLRMPFANRLDVYLYILMSFALGAVLLVIHHQVINRQSSAN